MEDTQTNAINGTFLVCVSDQQESEVALRFACLRAKRRHAQVAILHVIPPDDFQGLFAVSEVMKQEKDEAAQALINRMSDLARQSGITPSVILKEGILGEEIVTTTLENGDVIAVVLGVTHASPTAPKLLSWLTSKLGQELLIPILVVPGNLTDSQLEALI